MKRLMYLLLLGLVFTSCHKEQKKYTVEGRLMSACGVAASLKSMWLGQEEITLTSVGGKLVDFTCDENGYFSVSYVPESGGTLYLVVAGSAKVLIDIPCKENINLGEVYYNPPAVNFLVRLQANNAYTSADTLYYYDWNYPQNGATSWIKKVPGPFQSGIIDTVLNAGYMNFPLSWVRDPEMTINYYVNTYDPNQQAKVIPELCSPSYAEAVLTVD